MSTYYAIAAIITYKNKTAFDKAFKFMNNDGEGWIVDGQWFRSECDSGALFPDADDPTAQIDPEHLTITIPQAYYRGLASNAETLFAGATGKMVWTSTDGMFEGGVITAKDGVITEKSYDLEKWWKEQGNNEAQPDEDDPDAVAEYQDEVQQAFLDTFQP
ncbi:MAG: hypothetical protein ABSH08_13300 [Tepidisphaeraceae bacterium]|jgi:hypothetical protein